MVHVCVCIFLFLLPLIQLSIPHSLLNLNLWLFLSLSLSLSTQLSLPLFCLIDDGGVGLIGNGGVGLIGFFWVFMGLGFSSLIGDSYVGLIRLFWVFVGLGISGLIGDGGVDLIGFFLGFRVWVWSAMVVWVWSSFSGFPWGWVFPAMVVVFTALGNGFDRRGDVVDGGFGSRMVSLVLYLQVVGPGFMNLVWMNVKEYLVMGLWVYFLDLWVWFTRGFNTEGVRIFCVEIDYKCWPVGFVLIWWRT